MHGLYGKSKKYIDIQNYIVALPERRDTFHSLKMVGKEKRIKIKVQKINKWGCYYKVGVSSNDRAKLYQ